MSYCAGVATLPKVDDYANERGFCHLWIESMSSLRGIVLRSSNTSLPFFSNLTSCDCYYYPHDIIPPITILLP